MMNIENAILHMWYRVFLKIKHVYKINTSIDKMKK